MCEPLSLKMPFSVLPNVSQNFRNAIPSGCWSHFRLSYLTVTHFQVLYGVDCLQIIASFYSTVKIAHEKIKQGNCLTLRHTDFNFS